MKHLPPTAVMDLATRVEVNDRFVRLDSGLREVNKRIDRVLLAWVGGVVAILAAIIASGAFA